MAPLVYNNYVKLYAGTHHQLYIPIICGQRTRIASTWLVNCVRVYVDMYLRELVPLKNSYLSVIVFVFDVYSSTTYSTKGVTLPGMYNDTRYVCTGINSYP